MRAVITTIFCSVSLLAQGPSLESYRRGELVTIDARPDIPRYEYTIWNGASDAFTGASREPLRVRLHHKVSYALKDRSLYIIDESGIIHETRYFRQTEMVPKR
jgi:hypothetical protein